MLIALQDQAAAEPCFRSSQADHCIPIIVVEVTRLGPLRTEWVDWMPLAAQDTFKCIQSGYTTKDRRPPVNVKEGILSRKGYTK